jgi:long-chain fatty acid transport protein
MIKKSTVLSVLALFFALSSLALANGLNLNSLGSRALAMGGAFVGLADDYSTIFWNPAGMTHFSTKYFGFYGTDLIPSGSYKFEVPTPSGLLTLVDAKTESKHYLSGLAAYYHPINEYLVAGIGVYVPSGLGAVWDGSDFTAVSDNAAYQWESRISLVTIAPAIAYKINDMVSVGAALNINYGMFSLKTHAGTADLAEPPYELDLGQYEENLKGWGFGATLGVQVKANEMLSFGATVRTPSKIKFSGEALISNLDLLGFKEKSDAERDVTWPLWIAAGVAFRPMEGLILTGDLQWTQWSKINVIETRYIDPFWSLFMAAGGRDVQPMRWKDTLQVRFGAEYMLQKNLALRGGYYYDPTPAPNQTLNVLLPSYTFNVFTLGLGYNLNGLAIDFGFELLLGKQREVDYGKVLYDLDYASAQPGVYKMKIAVPNISISYKF